MTNAGQVAAQGASAGGIDGQQGIGPAWSDGWSLQESDGSRGNTSNVANSGEIYLNASGGTTPGAKNPRQEIHQKGNQQWTRSDNINAMSVNFDGNNTDSGMIAQLFATGAGPALQIMKGEDGRLKARFFEDGPGGKGTGNNSTRTVDLGSADVDDIQIGIAVEGDTLSVNVNGQAVEGSLAAYDANQKFSYKTGMYGKQGSQATITDIDLIKDGASSNGATPQQTETPEENTEQELIQDVFVN